MHPFRVDRNLNDAKIEGGSFWRSNPDSMPLRDKHCIDWLVLEWFLHRVRNFWLCDTFSQVFALAKGYASPAHPALLCTVLLYSALLGTALHALHALHCSTLLCTVLRASIHTLAINYSIPPTNPTGCSP
ncbi:hypothetical protein HOY82DRAFT_540919 [Tuber indicum]|nr:hypothetical protein HOY82DRAFT_540919 [Tuber indicum]